MENKDASQQEIWASDAAYEPYVGRWNRRVAREFLIWLNVPAGSHWLDVGYGTGALSYTILGFAAPSSVKGIDRAADYVAFAQEQVRYERMLMIWTRAGAFPSATPSPSESFSKVRGLETLKLDRSRLRLILP